MRIKPGLIIGRLKENNFKVMETASGLGIHRSTVYRWLKRAGTGFSLSANKLKRKSTRPRRVSLALSPDMKSKIEALRLKRHYTAEKIVYKLKLDCSAKTVHRFLFKRNLVRQYGYHRRPRFQNTLHMHAKNTKTIGYLQMDVKYITPDLSGLPYTCFEYAVIDIFSRYKEAVISNHLDQDGSMAALLEILPKLPFKPVFIQTDNGLEFQGRFHKMCEEMKLKHHLIHKNTPNENALIERSFRTDEEEFFFWLEKAPAHYDELRSWFAAWLHEYNYERPHLGIDLKTPYEVVANVLSD
ncbi:DDE-type integrase/transposase/recombinase [Candidatus Gottesmanbacteria bacterium]|nr:DDE-type integrase/transposase/recombinase [Candidatus Gottesmanbacteria bacterium]